LTSAIRFAQLACANIGGHIELVQSRLVDLAALLQARTALEPRHCIRESVIPTVARTTVLRQVAFHRKALAQPLNIVGRGISPERFGDHGPTAIVGDAPIALSRFPRAEYGIQLERGSRVI
jgi:hypothetical protein